MTHPARASLVALVASLASPSCALHPTDAASPPRPPVVAPAHDLAPATGPVAPPPTAPGPVLTVLDVDGPAVVLDEAPEPSASAQSAPELVSRGNPVVVRRAVDAANLRDPVARSLGARYRLYDASGARCTVALDRFELVGRVVPHFGVVARWNGESTDDGSQPARASDATVASEAWDLARDAGGVVLAARVRVEQGECSGTHWAVPEGQDASVVAARPAEGSVRREALARFRALGAWRATEREYARSHGARPARWDEANGDEPSVLAMPLEDGVVRVWVEAHAGFGCGDFQGSLAAMWDVATDASGEARWTSEYSSTEALTPTPSAAIELGAGRVDVLFDEARLSLETVDVAGYRLDAVRVPFLDCGC